MSKRVIVPRDAIEANTTTAEVVVHVRDSLRIQEIEEPVAALDLANDPGLDWQNAREDREIHTATVIDQSEQVGQPDVAKKRGREGFVAILNQWEEQL